jgi:hypothetical protein
MKSINIFKIWWKKGNNFKMGNKNYFKIAGYVDLDMLNMLLSLSLNCNNVQHIKIYLPCNFEVNLSTQYGVVALFFVNFSKC